MRHGTKKAFTLIELLVVVAIIAIRSERTSPAGKLCRQSPRPGHRLSGLHVGVSRFCAAGDEHASES